MEASAATLLLLALCLACLLLLLRGGGGGGGGGRWGTKARLPPGPRPLPFIGNLPHLDTKNMIKSLLQLSRQYGSLFTIHLGSRPVVVLCGYQVVKEALVDRGEEFSGRGDMPVLFRFTQGNGVAFSNGEKWKILRRFAIQTLRDFGMGKRSIEERIQEEAQCLVKELAKRTEPFDPTFLLGCSVSNIICSIVFGDRFDYEDQHFLTFIGLINDNFRLFSSPCAQMYNIFPHIMYYLPGPHNRIFANFEKLRVLVREMVKAHQASLDPSCPRDFIDCFLLKMQQEKGDPCSFFHTDTLIMTTHNLFFAGTETISTTLRYAILILMKFPEVAAKVQEEIAKVIGPERLPSIADRARMPYTDAVIHEVQRFADIIPMGIPHALTKDTHFRGFFFPEGTNVLPFFHSVHRDPTQFKEPGRFEPGHFLDEEGAFRRSSAFMPFSAARLPPRPARPLAPRQRHRERASALHLPPAAPLRPPRRPPPSLLRRGGGFFPGRRFLLALPLASPPSGAVLSGAAAAASAALRPRRGGVGLQGRRRRGTASAQEPLGALNLNPTAKLWPGLRLREAPAANRQEGPAGANTTGPAIHTGPARPLRTALQASCRAAGGG